jgi:hypothetical protein
MEGLSCLSLHKSLTSLTDVHAIAHVCCGRRCFSSACWVWTMPGSTLAITWAQRGASTEYTHHHITMDRVLPHKQTHQPNKAQADIPASMLALYRVFRMTSLPSQRGSNPKKPNKIRMQTTDDERGPGISSIGARRHLPLAVEATPAALLQWLHANPATKTCQLG